jgi:DNA mismatch endonuclease (patch repair protein)
MSRIRGKDTTPEKVVRSLLHRMGYRFRLHVRIPIPDEFNHRGHGGHGAKHRGRSRSSKNPTIQSSDLVRVRYVRPDIVLPKYKTVIFVHGCFWHRCEYPPALDPLNCLAADFRLGRYSEGASP